MDERECVTHAKDVLTSIEGMKNDEQFCDFILKIGEEEIPVHRMILAACSKYFHAMFSHDTTETKTGRAEIIGIEPSAGKQCLEFAYTGKIKFSRENPKDLIHAAELMQFHSLVDLYFEYLVENISPRNCLEYMVLALTYNQGSFAKIFEKLLAENFAEIIKTEDFASMSQALLSKCMDCLPDETQNAEKLKWEAVTTWVKGDLENRKDVFPELFKTIKLKNMPTDFIKEKISKEELIRQSLELTGVVLDTLSAEERPATTSESAKFPTHMLAFQKESRFLLKYDMNLKKCSRLMRVPAYITGEHVDIVSKEGEIFVGTESMLCKYYEGVWTTLVTTGYGSRYCRCLVSGPFVFMVTSEITVKYDTRNNTIDKTNRGCGLGIGFAIAASNDWLCAIGGESTGKKAKEFNLTTKTWEPIADMKYERIDRAAVFFRGKLFALGGSYYDKLFSRTVCSPFEYYEPSVDKWIQLHMTATAEDRCLLSCFKVYIIGDKLYAFNRNLLKGKELDLELSAQEPSMQLVFPQFCPAHLV